jgi:DNA-binding Lrp family transcriptional regulator
VDELDLRILGSLAWKPGDPAHMARGILRPWDIARALGVHGNTVKARLEEMRAAGVLQGVYLVPVGALPAGMQIGVYWLRFAGLAEKRAGLAALAGRPMLAEVTDFVGDRVRLGIHAPGPELERVAEEVRRAAGAVEARRFYRREFPQSPRVTDLDLRILDALVEDALRPFSDVADEVGVTQRTVRLRFRALAEQRAFAIIPQMVLGNVQGLVAYELVVEFREPMQPEWHAALLRAFPEAFYRSRPTLENAYLDLAARTADGIEASVAKALAMPGVARAEALLMRAQMSNVAGVHGLIARRRQELQAVPA